MIKSNWNREISSSCSVFRENLRKSEQISWKSAKITATSGKIELFSVSNFENAKKIDENLLKYWANIEKRHKCVAVTYIPRPESWASLWCCTLCGYRIENWFCSVCAAGCALCLGAGCGAGGNHLRTKQSFTTPDVFSTVAVTLRCGGAARFWIWIDCRDRF